uniref:Uncharacterized protein n=1 Tax=Tanacetum cinerariifolium TaxID=118510 RepID=A0A699GXN6_TANCI|nr:hypothetical protein [Tanacetum cinerariifolium]
MMQCNVVMLSGSTKMEPKMIQKESNVLDGGSDVLNGSIMVVEVMVKWNGGGEVEWWWHLRISGDEWRKETILHILYILDCGFNGVFGRDLEGDHERVIVVVDWSSLAEDHPKLLRRMWFKRSGSSEGRPFSTWHDPEESLFEESKIKVFSKGKTVDHVAEISTRMVLISLEAYSVLTKDDFPFFDIGFQFGYDHLEGVEGNVYSFDLAILTKWSRIEKDITN